jgi:CHAT domain
MTDEKILDALNSLLPAQFETVLLRAHVPYGIVSPPAAPQTIRATELIQWIRQSAAQLERLRAALATVAGDHMRDEPVRPAERPAVPTILFLASEPTDAGRLRLGQEIEAIRDRLRVEIHEGRVRLDSRWAVRPRDLSQVLLVAKPTLVHFAAHGSQDRRLVLEADNGKMTSVAPDALEGLFRLFPEVEGVVLNACWSEDQAEALARCVPHVVGMRDTITDPAAIAFASGLYGALAAGRAFPKAFEFACAELRLLGIAEHLTPVLMTRGEPIEPRLEAPPPRPKGRETEVARRRKP